MFEKAFEQSALQNEESINSSSEKDVTRKVTSKQRKSLDEGFLTADGVAGGQDSMLGVLLEDSKFFRIDDRQHEFSDLDPIFCIDRPTQKNEQLLDKGVCMCCDATFKSMKTVHYW